MLALYSLTLFVSALLLFSVQPMVGRMILPQFGGTPAVWNTCMVFFQAALLAGYGYAHLSSRWLGARKQPLLHCAVMLLPLIALPISFSGMVPPTATDSASLWLLARLTLVAGLPFFVVATSAPLLQKWFSQTNHPAADDPYFLYAASNTGSMLALLGYPFVIEPLLDLSGQASAWTMLYGVLIGCVVLCAIVAVRSGRQSAPVATTTPPQQPTRISWRQRSQWIVLSLVPSSLMLGVTTFITTDIGSAPLLWVLPLALYLFTFVIVFSPRCGALHPIVRRSMPFIVLPIIPLMFSHLDALRWAMMPIHLLAFLVITLFCHGELARRRPDAGHLTEFYLWMSVGGVLGGAFNALIAPQLFDSVAEYPLMLVVACFLRVLTERKQTDAGRGVCQADFYQPAGVAIATLVTIVALRWAGDATGDVDNAVAFAVPALLCFGMKERPLRFALSYSVAMVSFALWSGWERGNEVYADRGFFGVNRVTLDDDGEFVNLYHGRTLHGLQRIGPERSTEPLSYYHHTGPMGQVFAALNDDNELKRVAIIGLGSGAAASHARPGQHFTFFEIDPLVKQIAMDERFFTYLRDCPGRSDIVLGDARIQLENVPDGQFDLLVLDAFSSDSIPTHLLTREALQLYLRKLSDRGVLLFHISNLYMHLEPVVSNAAAEEGLTCLHQLHEITREAHRTGVRASEYVVIARRAEHLRGLRTDDRWRPAQSDPSIRVWTDSYSNLTDVLMW